MPDLFKIAAVSAAHGIRGEVKLACFLENPEDITRYLPLCDSRGTAYFLRITGQGGKNHLIAAIDGITDRNRAELLRGLELYAECAKRPPANDSEYYLQDLIGLPAVQASDGSPIGTVSAFHNYGAGELIEILCANGEELLLPFRAPFVGDIENGQISITLPHYSE